MVGTDYLLPIPLIHIDGMNVIKFLIRSQGIHICIDTSSRSKIHLSQLHPLPFCKRMHHLRLTGSHILNRKGHRPLDTVQIVIKSSSAHHDHGGSNPEKSKLSRKIFLEHILDSLDGFFGILQ